MTLASAEAAEDDAYFEAGAIQEDAKSLFLKVQAAWDARDLETLAALAGPDLIVEWRRRLADFAQKGWHNRVEVRSGPSVEYVGLVNREDDTEDRVVVRLEAAMDDWCVTQGGGEVFHDGATSAATTLREYWTLARSGVTADAHWIVLSIEQDAEGLHNLDADIVASPWADTKRIGADATFEVAAAEGGTEGFTTADLVDPGFAEDARAAALDLSLADPRFGPDVISACVTRAVEAWLEAVDGPDAALEALATPEAIRALLHPGDSAQNPNTRLVARGVTVESIDVQALRPTPEPAQLTVALAARGRRYVEDRDTTALLAGSKDDERRFVDTWTLALTGDSAMPWRLAGAAPAGF
ncbi:TIM44-like domain-containing protein [Paraconexibacter antarcticus]|uniref:TIM44-like domain-containing protein n=1 Tax=Paraconexibacter antarcticus TaxID=2949664 RepID=A0ABY5DYD5_9ACTN|nr:TIM44-like domain-containing protein [Paraconexibacter antarcticus]